MASVRGGKISGGPPELPADAQPPGGQLETLARRLHDLWDLLGQTNQQLVGLLMQRDPATAASDQARVIEALDALRLRVELIVERLGASPPAPVAKQVVPAALADEEPQRAFFRLLREKLETLEHRGGEISDALRRISDLVAAPAAAKPAAPAADDLPVPAAPVFPLPRGSASGLPRGAGAWPSWLLGAELAGNPQLDGPRQQLLDALSEGDAAARSLVGQLLVFQGATAEKLPTLLKEIGEAYYRWQPKRRPVAAPLEAALARWLQERCQAAGINNTIELVNPGERFDTQRHTSTSRGVEIVEVQGWIVLRDNGKVYTKATVAVT